MLRVKRDFFPGPFRVLPSDIIFPSLAYVTQCLQINSQVFEVSKILSTVFMMSELRWTAVENVVSFSKRSTVIKFASNVYLNL